MVFDLGCRCQWALSNALDMSDSEPVFCVWPPPAPGEAEASNTPSAALRRALRLHPESLAVRRDAHRAMLVGSIDQRIAQPLQYRS